MFWGKKNSHSESTVIPIVSQSTPIKTPEVKNHIKSREKIQSEKRPDHSMKQV